MNCLLAIWNQNKERFHMIVSSTSSYQTQAGAKPSNSYCFGPFRRESPIQCFLSMLLPGGFLLSLLLSVLIFGMLHCCSITEEQLENHRICSCQLSPTFPVFGWRGEISMHWECTESRDVLSQMPMCWAGSNQHGGMDSRGSLRTAHLQARVQQHTCDIQSEQIPSLVAPQSWKKEALCYRSIAGWHWLHIGFQAKKYQNSKSELP